MAQLFQEVTSPKNADKAESEQLKTGAAQEGSAAPDTAPKKGKHGDPGVCCGGCS